VSGTAAAVCFVVAVAENGVMGREGELPWRQSTDLKLFRRLTLGKPVIMGRKTFESIGKPLDGRDNIVVSRDPSLRGEGIVVAASPAAALVLGRDLAAARNSDEIAVIGGAQIFRALLAQADRIYLTRVHAAPAGDTYFPPLELAQWREASRETLARSARDEHPATLVVLERVR